MLTKGKAGHDGKDVEEEPWQQEIPSTQQDPNNYHNNTQCV